MADPAPRSPRLSAPAPLSFLVVEDEPFQRSMVVGMLAALGATVVHEAADGTAAIELLEGLPAPPDIVVSDLDMPGVDGMELIRWISMHAGGAALIVASAMEAELLASVEAMAAAYGVHLLGTIRKPVTRRKLQELIEHYGKVHGTLAGAEAPATAFSGEAIVKALANGEFEPYFQPQVEIRSGAPCGVEALARWRHPEQGVVSPAFFVATLERIQKIDLLLESMLRQAARFRRSLQRLVRRCRVSVNISPVSLANLEVGEQIQEIVREEGADPRDIVLEMTESAATTDVGHALENLARLRMKGFELAIDDYGTGYSSLEQLTRAPFSEVKIDQRFVIPAIRKPSARIVLKSTLDMARRLGLRTVAEGVEHRAHLELLSRLGCEIAQGYYFAHPMPAAACLDWFSAQRRRVRR
jgi:EAL domain-containing protein (putative c-di-GMP-specific phosphodiesterase class I)/CheY-like chemotaxis protein